MTTTRKALARALYATSGISDVKWEELQQGVRTALLSHADDILAQLGARAEACRSRAGQEEARRPQGRGQEDQDRLSAQELIP